MSAPTITAPPEVPTHRLQAKRRRSLSRVPLPAPSRSARARGSRQGRPTWRVYLTAVSATVSVLLLWTVAYLSIFSGLQHARSQHELYATFRNQVANGVAPIGGSIATGRAVAVLHADVPGLGGEVVVEGTTSGALRAGPGHLSVTPLPGQAGDSIIYGRSLAFGAPFAHIDQLRPGDTITVTTGQGTFRYRILDLRQAGDQLPAALLQVPASLTLVARVGGWGSGHLIYVDGLLTTKPVAAPSGRPTTLPHSEGLNTGEHDQLTLIEVVLWLQVLAVTACVLGWLHVRWGRWQLWLVGMPLVLAVLWGLSNTAVRLLPNML